MGVNTQSSWRFNEDLLDTAPEKHPCFNKVVLRYDAEVDQWTSAGEVPTPRVTVPCVLGRGAWGVPSGELHPGVRSAEVSSFATIPFPQRAPRCPEATDKVGKWHY